MKISQTVPQWPGYGDACQQIIDHERELARRWPDGRASLPAPAVQDIQHPLFASHQIEVALLCAHQIDPILSGNKWYKLKYNVLEAVRQECTQVVSWGGVWSNHLHALAAAGQRFGLHTVGIVRGEEHVQTVNPMLDDIRRWGMQLNYVSRQQYALQKHGTAWPVELDRAASYVIPEGGDNALGVLGCMTLVPEHAWHGCDEVILPVGTGCTLLGVRLAVPAAVRIRAILPMRDRGFATRFAERLKCFGITAPNCVIDEQWHGGGFGRITPALQTFMAEFEALSGVRLDPVYTGKMLYGVCAQISAGCWQPGARLLILHTGGLQGRRSLSGYGET